MAIPWPSTLQQNLDSGSFSLSTGSTVLRSNVDQGPAKVRRRGTRGVDTISASITVSAAQYQILVDFINTDLNGGVNVFEMDHPITGVLTEFRLLAVPSYRTIGTGGLYFSASFQLEVMP